MTFEEICNIFACYGADTALLALLTVATVQLLKKTVFKNVQKKMLTFLPVALGIIFYAAYAAAVHASFYFLVENLTLIAEKGVGVGALATVYYVAYEQFVRGDLSLSGAENVIAELISGYVNEGTERDTATAVAKAVQRDVTGNGTAKTAEIISGNARENVSAREIQTLSRVIVECLAHMR